MVINKIDRENARPHKVLDMVFDLFVELNATDEQLDFPVIYASAKEGYAMREIHEPNTSMEPLFEAIVKYIPPPPTAPEAYFQMLVSNLDYSDYLGRLAFGRIVSGRVKVGDSIVCIHKDGRRERDTVTALFGHQGLDRIEVKHAGPGDIIGLAGFEEISIGETLTDLEERPALEFVDIDPPTIKMNFLVNDSPLRRTRRQVADCQAYQGTAGSRMPDQCFTAIRRDGYGRDIYAQCSRRNANRDSGRTNASRRIRTPGFSA